MRNGVAARSRNLVAALGPVLAGPAQAWRQSQRTRRPLPTAPRLARDRSSTATLEFALVGSLFLLFVLMIMELVLQLATQATLDNAACLAARQIRIGNISGSNYAGNLTNTVCGY